MALLSLNDGPFFTLVAMGASGLANIPILSILAAITPIIVGMILGNLDKSFSDFLAPAGPILIPFVGLTLGARMMAVLDPIKLVIDNYPEGQIEYLDAPNNLENEELGSRQLPFGRELYIEREDFMEEPPKKYFRLFPGNEVRLMNAYFVTCTGFEKDEDGNVTVVHCTYDPETKSGSGFTGRKVKGTIHWVEASTALPATVRLYENLIDEEKGVYNKEDGSLNLNPNSLTEKEIFVESNFADAKAYESFQFVRQGYFCVDSHDSSKEHLVFNRIVSLKSSFRLPK